MAHLFDLSSLFIFSVIHRIDVQQVLNFVHRTVMKVPLNDESDFGLLSF